MDAVGTLENATKLAKEARAAGVKIFHAPITFAHDGMDNPNRNLGILAGCHGDRLFVRGSWNAQICDALTPQPGDVVVEGKRGPSAFPNTTLMENLRKHNIETIALGGFMANCCVESTLRDAFERGFNMVTLTDCVATTSMAGYKASTEITYPFFSTPMNTASFLANIKAAAAVKPLPDFLQPFKKAKLEPAQPHPLPTWAFESVATNVYQAGPWFVDVRHRAVGEKIVLDTGEKELERYLDMAEGTGMMGDGICARCDSIYARKMPAKGESTEPFGWMCNMSIVRLPPPLLGCMVYSPVLPPDGSMATMRQMLAERDLLPVRIVVCPSPQHHLCLKDWQGAFPDAALICGRASGQMPPLVRKRRDLRFDGVLMPGKDGTIVLGAAVPDKEGDEPGSGHWRLAMAKEVFTSGVVEVSMVDDNRSGEVVVLHRPSKVLLISDLLYKSDPTVVGPGGKTNHYTLPEWFAEGQQELFYGHPQDNSGNLLPAYRTHPCMRSIDLVGMRKSLAKILSWDFHKVLACHVDVMTGDEARALIEKAWAWVSKDMSTVGL